MFKPEHEIWQIGSAFNELDLWLDPAQDLIEKWKTQHENEVQFNTTFEVTLASALLKDNLLPPSARRAYANLMLDTINAAYIQKISLQCLHIKPPKPGRKADISLKLEITFGVRKLIQSGIPKSKAYKAIADRHHKSPDTVRRIYERAMRNSVEASRKGGEINS